MAASVEGGRHTAVHSKMASGGMGRLGGLLMALILGAGIVYVLWMLTTELEHAPDLTALPFILLVVALLIALGFEFVNGFHDTANAVATVIYTHSLAPNVAVVWSGICNLTGVLVSSGAVAFSVITLLPVDLILQVGSDAGFAMVFALLIAAIIWNLGTWWFGLPNSSSHTLIGSIIGVGIANAWLSPSSGTSGVEWAQALTVGKALLFSPIIGFVLAALLLLIAKAVIRNPALYQEPKGDQPPPFWIRCLLILTCTGVSFAHGSNDGQKGMGLIMLILIGTVPTAYALNKSMPQEQVVAFDGLAGQAADVFAAKAAGATVQGDPRPAVLDYLHTKQVKPETLAALSALSRDVGQRVSGYQTLSAVPAQAVKNERNDMYMLSESINQMGKRGTPVFEGHDKDVVSAFKGGLDQATKFIPTWVKIAVAIALGLGTMVGWKRIVVTVGEKIGKEHLTYGQGAAAEIVAMFTIGLADRYGLPVSTTHVLSSGVAGTMTANGSGLQMGTLRNIAAAWLLTLPAAALLAAILFAIFRAII